MPRRKEPKIPDAILDQLLAGADAKTAFDPNGLLDELKKALAERAPVLNQIMFYPLGQFDGKMKTTDWRKLPIFPVPAGAAGELGGAESDEGLAIFERPEGIVAVMSPTAVPSANVAMTVAQ